MDKYITILFTDTHFGTHNNSLTWFKSQKNFIENQFIPHLQKRKDEGYQVRVIHCGDVFDSRSTLNTYIATGVVEMFEKICSIVDKFYILGGNHDYMSPATDDVDSIRLVFKHLQLKYPSIFESVTRSKLQSSWGTEESLFVPWYEWIKKDDLIEYLENNNHKITHIFTHADLVREGTDIDCPNIISGHIHIPYFKDNIKNLGSCFALTFTDANQERGFYEYEDGGELKFIKNEKSLRFWRFYNKEILTIPDNIDSADFIELYATKSLLLKKKYTDACNKWMNKFRNIDLIPQIEDGEVVTDIQKFEGYNIETMTEGLIPDELKDKFEKVKQYINSIKD